jgi:hypothetical protein
MEPADCPKCLTRRVKCTKRPPHWYVGCVAMLTMKKAKLLKQAQHAVVFTVRRPVHI